MFDQRCRAGVERGLRPVGSTLDKAGISADQLTVAGLVISAGAAVAIGAGWLIAGMLLLAASALPDVLDGAVAKASGKASPRGAFFDSVSDRVSDSLVLGGVAWYLAETQGGLVALLPMAVLAASFLVSYERARAESLGFTARGGLMERAERMIVIGIGLAFSVVLIPVLWLMLGLTLITAGQRFMMVWRQATPGAVETEPLLARWLARRPPSRYRPGGEREIARWRSARNPDGRLRASRRSRTRP
ncbi:MAG: CDP-alcohol phosphatidyltransferase family protein [Actinomycetota bacterium]|nr:CDP-alcohol phosphatidyltransferase family protein [Actinomycetota bacterium]